MTELMDQKTITVTVKLYASLGAYLPKQAKRNQSDMQVSGPDATVEALFHKLGVPEAMCHLVLVNGHYVAPSDRAATRLKDGDHLAAWPPVAGG